MTQRDAKGYTIELQELIKGIKTPETIKSVHFYMKKSILIKISFIRTNKRNDRQTKIFCI